MLTTTRPTFREVPWYAPSLSSRSRLSGACLTRPKWSTDSNIPLYVSSLRNCLPTRRCITVNRGRFRVIQADLHAAEDSSQDASSSTPASRSLYNRDICFLQRHFHSALHGYGRVQHPGLSWILCNTRVLQCVHARRLLTAVSSRCCGLGLSFCLSFSSKLIVCPVSACLSRHALVPTCESLRIGLDLCSPCPLLSAQ